MFTGTGRCGTGFVAACSNAAGYPCEHEGIFDGHPGELARWDARSCSDASWHAIRHLDELIDRGVEVWWVTRPKEDVFRSFARIRFFEPAASRPGYTKFLCRMIDLRERDHPGDRIRGWIDWVYDTARSWDLPRFRVGEVSPKAIFCADVDFPKEQVNRKSHWTTLPPWFDAYVDTDGFRAWSKDGELELE